MNQKPGPLVNSLSNQNAMFSTLKQTGATLNQSNPMSCNSTSFLSTFPNNTHISSLLQAGSARLHQQPGASTMNLRPGIVGSYLPTLPRPAINPLPSTYNGVNDIDFGKLNAALQSPEVSGENDLWTILQKDVRKLVICGNFTPFRPCCTCFSITM